MPTTSSTTDGPAHQTVTRPASSTRHASANSSLASAAAQPAIPRRPRGLLALTRGESRTGSAEGGRAGHPAAVTRQHETACLALRHTLLDGEVLRSGDRPGIEQEMRALLTVCQLLRTAMVTAVETRPGTNPDRASFTTALETARDPLTAAAGICRDGPADLAGVIGRAVLATLLPARRPRFSARKVKCATSRYLNHGDQRPHAATAITAIAVTVRTPPLDDPATRASKRRPHRKTSALTGPQPPTRRQLITAIITGQPPRDWSGHELAIRLGVKPRTMLTQLREWARLLHPHRLRNLPAQHAARQYILDNRARPLTTRHCVAGARLRRP